MPLSNYRLNYNFLSSIQLKCCPLYLEYAKIYYRNWSKRLFLVAMAMVCIFFMSVNNKWYSRWLHFMLRIICIPFWNIGFLLSRFKIQKKDTLYSTTTTTTMTKKKMDRNCQWPGGKKTIPRNNSIRFDLMLCIFQSVWAYFVMTPAKIYDMHSALHTVWQSVCFPIDGLHRKFFLILCVKSSNWQV